MRYKIKYKETITSTYSVTIDAESEEEAKEWFENASLDYLKKAGMERDSEFCELEELKIVEVKNEA